LRQALRDDSSPPPTFRRRPPQVCQPVIAGVVAGNRLDRAESGSATTNARPFDCFTFGELPDEFQADVATADARPAAIGSLFAAPAADVQAADIKVEVTGSNIRRSKARGSLPIQVITREEIERTGATSAMDVLT
jgi:hypothetical protein